MNTPCYSSCNEFAARQRLARIIREESGSKYAFQELTNEHRFKRCPALFIDSYNPIRTGYKVIVKIMDLANAATCPRFCGWGGHTSAGVCLDLWSVAFTNREFTCAKECPHQKCAYASVEARRPSNPIRWIKA